MTKRLLSAFLGSAGANMAASTVLFVAVWALNPPAGCPLSRLLAMQRCPGDRVGILVNAAITVAITAALHLTVMTIWLARRRRAARTTTGGPNES